MKKLIIVCKDGSKVIYTMKNFVDYEHYLKRHLGSGIVSAILQRYPKKDNDPMILIKR